VAVSLPSPESQITAHYGNSNRALAFAAIEAGQQGQSQAQSRLDCEGIKQIKDPGARHARWLQAADELNERGYSRDAIGACKAAIAECPKNYTGFAMLATILLEQGRLEEAEAAVEAALACNADEIGMLNLAAGIALAQNRPAAAMARTAAILRLAPTNQRALALRIAALVQFAETTEVDYLLDFDRLLRVVAITPPPGFDSIGAFNTALSGAICSSELLDPHHIGKTMVGGKRLHDTFTIAPTLAASLRQIFKEETESYAAALTVKNTHPVRQGQPPNLSAGISWANITERADYEPPHIHDGSWLSGVYYVEMPAAVVDGGAIEFGGHDFNAALGQTGPTRLIRPKPGMMVLFPSYFYHRTLPFESCGRRISIAFDVKLAI
jgi:tetratricopeptide (TPR) repeat protein